MVASDFADLNPEQIKAVKQVQGPVLVLAGAGSGKTKALTHRIAYLMNDQKIDPMNILAITFTNKAAEEIRNRVKKLTGIKSDKHLNISTFHALCAKLLRRECHLLGYERSFSILDSEAQLTAVKQAMAKLQIDTKRVAPEAVRSYISSAKNELMNSALYAEHANGTFSKTVAKIYPVYQALIERAQAMDFDDLIMQVVRLFREYPDVLRTYQNQFQYILIDEYQDTNTAQYELSRMLAETHRNLFVVGDDWQCLAPSTPIETASGYKPIEEVKRGDLVRSASGYGKTGYFTALNKKQFSYKGELIYIKTKSGKTISCTPNHLMFARWEVGDAYFVYLMYGSGKGYRMGIAKGSRFDGKKYDIGLRVRANQERAERMWILKLCATRTEAMLHEALFAYQYGIPMMMFHAYANRAVQLTQNQIDTLYHKIDTHSRAKQLMSDLSLMFEYPHFRPQATTKNGIKRINVNVVLFGDRRSSQTSPWSASRLSVNTSNPKDLAGLKRCGLTVRSGRAGTYRVEAHSLDYGKLEQLLANLGNELLPEQVVKYAFMTNKKFAFTPASHLHPGAQIPIISGDTVIEDTVVAVERKPFEGKVYDLDIGQVHNYAPGGIVTHNSIYSWRGANFRNILNFNTDYPDAVVIKLEQNYRSSQNILDAGHALIEKNKHKSAKELWTDQTAGEPITIYEALNQRDESDFVVREIQALQGNRVSLNEMVILYRTNAQSRSLEEAMLQNQIPYKVVGGVKFYDRKEIKDMLAYLTLLVNMHDNLALSRIINEPARGIGKQTFAKLEELAETSGKSIYLYIVEAEVLPPPLEEFKKVMQTLESKKTTLTLSKLLDSLLVITNYKQMLTDQGLEGETRLENIFELKSVMEKYDHLPTEEALTTFLEEVSLIADIDTLKDDSASVTLMTLHAAKGLEFDYVFIAGMEENIFPHSRAIFDLEELEEERRLAYVGVTRAKKKVYLVYAQERLLYGALQNNPPSRFLEDIPADLTERIRPRGTSHLNQSVPSGQKSRDRFEPGQKVIHTQFGEGIIISKMGDTLTVAFKSHGIKNLAKEFAPMRLKK